MRQKVEITMFNYDIDSKTDLIENTTSKNSKKYLPLLDVYDDGENFIVAVELPGVPKENVKVKLEKGELIVKAERFAEKGVKFIHPERYFGSIERKVKFHSDIDENNIKASLENGVLKVTLKKLNNKREIKIN